MKVNVDAALSKNSDIVAMARDGAGAFMGASALVMKSISDPETAEVLACREGTIRNHLIRDGTISS
jgi:hypothetical protein